MRASLFAVAVLTSCQAGDTAQRNKPGVAKAREPISARPVVAAPSASGVTPMALIASEPPPATEVAAPFTLTASDGSGLTLIRIDAKAVVQGPLAFTELHLYFKNPEDRTREGTFAITLPPGAAVSRFAMEINGKFQEAEVIEKQMARRIYDDFLHRKQDPALLEKAAGNQFTAKVFPIPANAEKHLVVSFSQELAGRGYVLPLRGLPKTERVDVALTATNVDSTQKTQSLTKRDWQPDSDFIGTVAAPAAAVAAGELVVGTLTLAARTQTQAMAPQQLTLLVDTSASRALGFARYVTSVRELIAALRGRYGDSIDLQVVAFDQDTQVIYEGPASAYGDPQDKLLLARGAAGASDLAQAFGALATPRKRVVVVTDAVVTAGAETPAIVEAIKKMPIERVDVVLSGGIRDERLAASIVRAGLPQAGDVYDLDRGITTVAAGLGEPVLVDIAIDVPGAVWFYPKHVPAARPGSPLMVYARMPRPTQQIAIAVGGAASQINVGSATPALVERAVASAEIEELENKLSTITDAKLSKPLRDDITKRSIRSRVISSQTSLLVLETEADYARYKIDRTALADILTIGPSGLEQSKRTFTASTAKPQPFGQDPWNTDTQIARAEPAPAGGAFASLTGTGDISSGFEDGNVYGGLLGTETGEMNGGFGFGRSGFGPGGGGSGWGTIGTGRYGSLGHGSGTGSGYGVGGGRGGMRGRSASMPKITIGQPTVEGDLDKAIVRRYIKRNIQKITYCYEKELLAKPQLKGTVHTRFVIGPNGTVPTVISQGVDPNVSACIKSVISSIEFPKPKNAGVVKVSYPFTFVIETEQMRRQQEIIDEREWRRQEAMYAREARQQAIIDAREARQQEAEDAKRRRSIKPLEGKLADVMDALKRGNTPKASELATKWHDEQPADVLGLIALGEVLEAKKDIARAARIYGSIIDLFPMRADMRRFAGERLSRLDKTQLMVDTYRRAVADRPDHATGHRLLAYALVRTGDFAGAFSAILAGVDQKYPNGRFLGATRVLAEDAGMIAAAYIAHGGKREDIVKQLATRNIELATKPSTRFIMYWETDSNDVDFHIRDARGGHAWYSNQELPSGGELYADITTGYGPECFAIQGTPTAGPYKIEINYYSQGPMGYGMGLLQIQRFDGKNFKLEDRPYVVMTDGAFVELGSYQ